MTQFKAVPGESGIFRQSFLIELLEIHFQSSIFVLSLGVEQLNFFNGNFLVSANGISFDPFASKIEAADKSVFTDTLVLNPSGGSSAVIVMNVNKLAGSTFTCTIDTPPGQSTSIDLYKALETSTLTIITRFNNGNVVTTSNTESGFTPVMTLKLLAIFEQQEMSKASDVTIPIEGGTQETITTVSFGPAIFVQTVIIPQGESWGMSGKTFKKLKDYRDGNQPVSSKSEANQVDKNRVPVTEVVIYTADKKSLKVSAIP